MELKPWETWKQQAWGFCDKCKNAHICQTISKGAQLLWESWPHAKYSQARWRLCAWIILALAAPTEIPSAYLWQVPRQAQLAPRCPEVDYCTLPEPQTFAKIQCCLHVATALPRTVGLQCCSCICPTCSLNAEVLPDKSQLQQVEAGRLCAAWLEPVVLESLTQEQWSSSGEQQPRPCPGPAVTLKLVTIAAVPDLEEDKMKPQTSLIGVGMREEGATWKVWSKKRGGRSW